MSAGHRHGTSVQGPQVVRGQRALTVVVVVLLLATLAGLLLLRPTGRADGAFPTAGERVQGTVTRAATAPCDDAGQEAPENGPRELCVDLTVRIDEGPDKGVEVGQQGGDNATGRLAVGDRVVLAADPAAETAQERYQLTDTQRATSLTVLAVLFALAVVALGRLRGLLALAGLAVSAVVLVGWLVPALLDGRPPVLTATVGASAIMLAVLLLAHGPSVRTMTAIVGTAASLLLTLALAGLFVEASSLTGLTSEEASFVQAVFGGLDVRGLLLAGIVVGALGILDDVTVTQVSAVHEIRAADPAMPTRDLYRAGLRVGRDHVASLVNTLLLAYAGASLPLLVIFTTSGEGLVGTLTNGVVAEEIVRALVGSIGLVAAVPITTALAAITCPPTAPADAAPGPEAAGPAADPRPRPAADRMPPEGQGTDPSWSSRQGATAPSERPAAPPPP